MQCSRRQWMIQAGALVTTALVSGPGYASTGQYPNRAIRFVVPYPAGGSTDLVARLVGQKLSGSLGQPVVVENRTGASGMIGMEHVARSDPDGYTLMLGITAMVQLPAMYKSMPVDTIKDFEPVSLVGRVANVFVVPQRLGVKSFAEFVALAKSQPGKLSYGSFGTGTVSHLYGELMKKQEGVDMVHVPYRGSGPLVQALMSGEIDGCFIDVATIAPHAGTNRVSILGITGTERSPLLQDVPTFAQEGYPGFESTGWYSAYFPAGTEKAIVDRISVEIARALQQPDVIEKLGAAGIQPVGTTSGELADIMQKDMPHWAGIIHGANITLD